MKTATLKKKAIEMIEGLPDQKLPSAVEYLEYLKGNYDSFDLNETVKEALYDLKLHKEGKLKLKTIDDLIDELKD
ncbi:hypothetical protein BMS3Bbin07_01407 [bacterium BMS3Bbin07]|nr:hypothetical protein BMS3Bbin07_01407 [bacterium BMS3Bbin07]